MIYIFPTTSKFLLTFILILLESHEGRGGDKALRDIHHEWHTNKCESMNKFITKGN